MESRFSCLKESKIRNFVLVQVFSNITIENVPLNGKRLTEEEMTIAVQGNVKNVKVL